MHFLADENISRLIVERLRREGHDVVSVREIGAGLPDPQVLGTSNLQDRVLLTEDKDFGDLVVRQRLPAVGVLLLELDPLSNSAQADRVTAVVAMMADKLVGSIAVAEPGRVRLRLLRR